MKLRIGGCSGGGEKSYIKLSEYGFQCADFGMANTEGFWYTCTHSEFEKRLLQEKSWAHEHGIEIHQLHGPWDHNEWDLHIEFTPEKLRRLSEVRKKAISACSYLGCKNMVIHPIFPYGDSDTKTGKAEETIRLNIELYSGLVETAKEYGVTICYENMPHASFSLNSVDSIKRVIDEINDDHFKACLDTGHVVCLNTQSLGDAVRTLGKDLKVLHVHDSKPRFDYHMIPYYGDGDWDSFYEGLKDIGYNGVFSLETLPSRKLSPHIYDEMAKNLVKIAKQIIHYDED